MGLLINGQWVEQSSEPATKNGHFVRKASSFRDKIGSARFPAEAGRYHIYISHACPWAHRTTIMRNLKGLDQIISMSSVEAVIDTQGWAFGQSGDPIGRRTYMHELYTQADSQYSGRVTVPVLWDKKEHTIVNNESSEIIRMLNTAFNDLTQNTADYYPQDLRNDIDAINEELHSSINNGVYKVGFSTTQEIYDEEVKILFSALDRLETHFNQQRYLVGTALSEADIRLFPALLRFDPVYVTHFKCNMKRIADYPNISQYIRDIFQMDAVKNTVHMADIKAHYFKSHLNINPSGIVPRGPLIDHTAPHNRTRFDD